MIWMAVSADEYELPLAIAESAPELARVMGCSEGNVRKKQWQDKQRGYINTDAMGRKLDYKIVKVKE